MPVVDVVDVVNVFDAFDTQPAQLAPSLIDYFNFPTTLNFRLCLSSSKLLSNAIKNLIK